MAHAAPAPARARAGPLTCATAGVEVRTAGGEVHQARALVLAAGAWMPDLLPELQAGDLLVCTGPAILKRCSLLPEKVRAPVTQPLQAGRVGSKAPNNARVLPACAQTEEAKPCTPSARRAWPCRCAWRLAGSLCRRAHAHGAPSVQSASQCSSCKTGGRGRGASTASPSMASSQVGGGRRGGVVRAAP